MICGLMLLHFGGLLVLFLLFFLQGIHVGLEDGVVRTLKFKKVFAFHMCTYFLFFCTCTNEAHWVRGGGRRRGSGGCGFCFLFLLWLIFFWDNYNNY